MNKRVNSLPLADVALHHDGIGRVCKDLARDITLSPNLRERLVNQVGSNPSSQALHGMRVVEMARFALPPW